MKETVETIETQTNTGIEISVLIRREDGSMLSMLKSTWDELEAQKGLGGTL